MVYGIAIPPSQILGTRWTLQLEPPGCFVWWDGRSRRFLQPRSRFLWCEEKKKVALVGASEHFLLFHIIYIYIHIYNPNIHLFFHIIQYDIEHLFCHILRISSSQLTFLFFRGGFSPPIQQLGLSTGSGSYWHWPWNHLQLCWRLEGHRIILGVGDKSDKRLNSTRNHPLLDDKHAISMGECGDGWSSCFAKMRAWAPSKMFPKGHRMPQIWKRIGETPQVRCGSIL